MGSGSSKARSKSPAPPPPPAKAKAKNNHLTQESPKKAAGSRRNSFAPYKENRPPATPTPRPPPTDPNMAQCPICTRSFAKDRLEKHRTICEKTAKKAQKRKPFDPVKMRVQGTESEQYIRKIKTEAKQAHHSPQKTDWRKQHNEFLENLRDAKRAQAHLDAGGDPRDLPTPKPAENPDYVQCPHCERKFNETAAERHIPKCTSKGNKPSQPARAGGKRR